MTPGRGVFSFVAGFTSSCFHAGSPSTCPLHEKEDLYSSENRLQIADCSCCALENAHRRPYRDVHFPQAIVEK